MGVVGNCIGFCGKRGAGAGERITGKGVGGVGAGVATAGEAAAGAEIVKNIVFKSNSLHNLKFYKLMVRIKKQKDIRWIYLKNDHNQRLDKFLKAAYF